MLNIRRFNQVLIHLLANCLESGFKPGIASQYEGDAVWVSTPHRGNHNKTVGGMTNVQVGNQEVKTLSRDMRKSFGNSGGRNNGVPPRGKDLRKCLSIDGFIIHEQNVGHLERSREAQSTQPLTLYPNIDLYYQNCRIFARIASPVFVNPNYLVFVESRTPEASLLVA